ncbi:MAG: toxin-antitoxin system YwqK family antitoxin [Leptospiraceae bacterium]|nr:toxin-antitoxin system YwqK family antitoxin [Leptospiraceae bacterium]
MQSLQWPITLDFRKVVLPVALTASLLSLCLPLALQAAPQRPTTVDARATYFAKTQVWYLNTDGKRIVWYANGQLKAQGPYSGDARQGHWIFYHSNGKKQAEGNFEKGRMVGTWTMYHSNGKKESEGEYKNNFKDGLWVLYDESGIKTSEATYKGGFKHGPWTEYYPGGGVFFKGSYAWDKADGQWTYYFRSGQLYQSGNFTADARTGVWKICIQPGGPCGQETFQSQGAPQLSGLDSTTPAANNTDDPADLLDSMESTKGVPPSMDGKWSNDL